MVSRAHMRVVVSGVVLVVAVALYALYASANTSTVLAAPPLQEEGTPDPCGPPILRPAGGEINVRSGPGLNYPAIASLDRDESARVLGRAAYVEFWRVELADGTVGWVGSGVVVVDGYIDDLPIVEPPPINNVTVTPGTETWEPVARTECLATYTPTPEQSTPTPTPAPDEEASSAADRDPWSPPVNVSKSGKATNLQSVTDLSGTTHVVWQEPDIGNFFYASGNSEGWTEALPVELPFGSRRFYPDLQPTELTPLFRPHLVTDATGRIHAFWIDETQALRYSSVSPEEFGSFSGWSGRQTLATNALVVNATTDASGRVYLVYIRTLPEEEAPAGVYYRGLGSEQEWSEPALLYNSAYLRSLTTDTANLQIAVSDSGGHVYVAWDNLPLEKIFMTRSADGGQTWEAPTEVDRREPEDNRGATGPGQIRLETSGDGVMLLWQAGHSIKTCTHYYQWSADNGSSWSTRRELEQFPDCFGANQLFSAGNGYIFLLTGTSSEAFMLAWDGEKWSIPQFQETLSAFVNPDTFQTVTLDCLQAHMVRDEQVTVVGCSVGEVQDAWVSARPVGVLDDWFPPPPVWSTSEQVLATNKGVPDLEVIADSNGQYHAFWTHQKDPFLYYARRENGNWSRPLSGPQSPSGVVQNITVVPSPDGQLLVSWDDSEGSIFFTRVHSERAFVRAEWAEPVRLPLARAGGSTPDIAIDQDGTIFIAYHIPFNEQRGIYIVRSADGGEVWSDPTRIFDGESAGWEMVGQPHLTVGNNRRVYVAWEQGAPLGQKQQRDGLALYYAYSTDGAQSFSDSDLVVEAPISWSDIVAVADRPTIHRLWQEGGTQPALYHQLSTDGGRTWQPRNIISSDAGVVSLTSDSAGQPHLLQAGVGVIRHWLWADEHWLAQADHRTDSIVNDIAASIAPDGSFGLVYASELSTQDSGPIGILFAQRSVELPSALLASGPELGPEPTATGTTTPSRTPEPSPTSAFPTSANERTQLLAGLPNNELSQIVISILPPGLLVLVVLIAGLYMAHIHRRS